MTKYIAVRKGVRKEIEAEDMYKGFDKAKVAFDVPEDQASGICIFRKND